MKTSTKLIIQSLSKLIITVVLINIYFIHELGVFRFIGLVGFYILGNMESRNLIHKLLKLKN